MDDTDPILDAKTIGALMAAVDARFHLGLPVTFPDGTVLGTIWRSGIGVVLQDGVYTATGTAPLSFAPAPNGVAFVRVTPTEASGGPYRA